VLYNFFVFEVLKGFKKKKSVKCVLEYWMQVYTEGLGTFLSCKSIIEEDTSLTQVDLDRVFVWLK